MNCPYHNFHLMSIKLNILTPLRATTGGLPLLTPEYLTHQNYRATTGGLPLLTPEYLTHQNYSI